MTAPADSDGLIAAIDLFFDSKLVIVLLGPLLAAALGALLGARVAGRHALSIEKFKLLAEMHREITSAPMIDVRVKSQNLMAAYRHYNLRQMYENKDVHPQMTPIWILIGFYERVFAAMRGNLIRRKKATELLAPLFLYFHNGFFVPQLLPAGWGLFGERMAELHDMFKKNATAGDWEEWMKQAKIDVEWQFAMVPKRRLE